MASVTEIKRLQELKIHNRANQLLDKCQGDDRILTESEKLELSQIFYDVLHAKFDLYDDFNVQVVVGDVTI